MAKRKTSIPRLDKASKVKEDVIDNEIMDKLKDILSLYVDDDVVITTDTLLVEDIGLSSLDAIQLGVIIEDEFGIRLKKTKVSNLFSVGDLASYIKEVK